MPRFELPWEAQAWAAVWVRPQPRQPAEAVAFMRRTTAAREGAGGIVGSVR